MQCTKDVRRTPDQFLRRFVVLLFSTLLLSLPSNNSLDIRFNPFISEKLNKSVRTA